MPQRLKPHSPEWFDAFQKINPLQAELTKQLIERAGHADICTTCGDPPLSDYLLEILPYITLRLCPSCRDIYLRTYGEKLIQLPLALPATAAG